MAKASSWPDVRLLSFDLQTVEFAYALVMIFSTYFSPLNSWRPTGLHRVYLV
jgi:hypothetical protein